jgi:hypothetical protein
VEPPDVEDDEVLDDEGEDGQTTDEAVVLGPGGIDDPETEWRIDAPTEQLRPFRPGEFVLVEPGEEPRWVDELPKPRHFKIGVAVSLSVVVLCSGRRRDWSKTPYGHSSDHGDAPIAHSMVVVFIKHGVNGNPRKPRKYLVVAGPHNELLGWLDYSNTWGLDAHVLEQIAGMVGLVYAIERYSTEDEFEHVHPDWVG